MAQRGKKKATRKEASGDGEAAKDPREAATGPAEPSDRIGSLSGDWSTAEPVVGEEDVLVDADPALETEDRPREFSAKDNPFESREPAREMDPSAPVASTDEALEEDFDPAPTHGMTQPPLGDEDTALSETLGMEGGLVHLVDREDMGKGVQNDPSAYAQGPGKPGLVEGATPAEDLRDTFLDPAARAGQARASAEDVLRARGMAETRDWSASGAMVEERDPRLLTGSSYLDAVLVGQAFPATKESIACVLAQEAWRNGGPSEAFHDLVVQLDQGLFQDLPDLKRALGDRFVWESAHGPSHRGGPHGR